MIHSSLEGYYFYLFSIQFCWVVHCKFIYLDFQRKSYYFSLFSISLTVPLILRVENIFWGLWFWDFTVNLKPLKYDTQSRNYAISIIKNWRYYYKCYRPFVKKYKFPSLFFINFFYLFLKIVFLILHLVVASHQYENMKFYKVLETQQSFAKSAQEIKSYSLIFFKLPIDSESGSTVEYTCCTRKAIAFTEIFD